VALQALCPPRDLAERRLAAPCPGTAARSATSAESRGRARRRPGSAGSSPPPPGAPGRPARLACAGSTSAGSAAPTAPREPAPHPRPAAVPRVRIGPFSVHKAAVPGQERARGHHPVQLQAAGQQPRQGSEHGTVSPVRPRAANAAPHPQQRLGLKQSARMPADFTPLRPSSSERLISLRRRAGSPPRRRWSAAPCAWCPCVVHA